MKRKIPNRYTDGELFICQGGIFGPKQIEIDPESLKGENLKLTKWYENLPQDGGYRFRAGFLGGKPWAEISIEFRNFCDAVVPWSYVCAAPATEAGKVIKRVDRRPEVSLYWEHLQSSVKRCCGSMEVMHEEPESDLSWRINKKPFADLAEAMKALDKAKKEHPRRICTLEKYEHGGDLVVALYGRDHGRMARQVDVSLPILPFTPRSWIRSKLKYFLDNLGGFNGTKEQRKEIETGMRWTVVNVI